MHHTGNYNIVILLYRMCSQQIPYSLAGILFVVTMIILATALPRLLILNGQTDGIFPTTTTLRYVLSYRVHLSCMCWIGITTKWKWKHYSTNPQHNMTVLKALHTSLKVSNNYCSYKLFRVCCRLSTSCICVYTTPTHLKHSRLVPSTW